MVGGGLRSEPTKLYYDTLTNKLIAGGGFRKADEKWITGIASWNGTYWDSLGHGLNFFDTLGSPNASVCSVWGMTRFNGDLYCTGNFFKAGHDSIFGFAKWNGLDWDTVTGASITSYHPVWEVMNYNNELYICGGFDSVGNVPADGIAKWDGTTWSAIGSNYNFVDQAEATSLQEMIFYHGNLYVSGGFYDPQGNYCRLAKWDGANWTFFTSVVTGGLAFIWDFEIYNDELYAGGIFYQTSGSVASSIIRWNDTTWRDVGGSIEVAANAYPTVCDMTVHNGKLYCAGSFEVVGGINAPFVASWDGTDWCGFGSIFDNKLLQVAFYEDTMYVAGEFWTIDGDSIRNIVKWIGGSFVDTCGNTTAIQESHEVNQPLLFPNPASEIVQFQFSDANETRIIILYDQIGREVWREETNESLVSISVYEFATGMYFYTVVSENDRTANGKFLIHR